MAVFSVRVTDEVFSKVQKLSKKEKVTSSKWLRDLIEKEVAKQTVYPELTKREKLLYESCFESWTGVVLLMRALVYAGLLKEEHLELKSEDKSEIMKKFLAKMGEMSRRKLGVISKE